MARCTWPSDAAASGSASNDAKAFEILTPRSSWTVLFDFGKRERLEPILQPRQRIEVRRRKQVGARGQQLAEFDEGRPELFKVGGKTLGVAVLGFRRKHIPFEHVVEASPTDEVFTAVLQEESGNIFVAAQSLGLE